MRRRLIGFALCSLMIAGLALALGSHSVVYAQNDATPEANPATPTAEPMKQPKIVTLVGWYSRDESGDFLRIGPLMANENLVAAEAQPTDRTLSGRIDFDAPDNDDLPRVQIGDSVLDAYPVFADDPDSAVRWIYFDGDPSLRPSTLMMQVQATAGPYEGAIGSVTLISRSEDGSGVLVVVLNLP